MPTLISFGAIYTNTPQQNAGVFIGETNITGWDAHAKSNSGHGAVFGAGNALIAGLNFNFDGLELIDGVIMDQDVKPSWSVQL
ncbi:hypothetical protein C7445_102180 [Alicyclobacillus sacchari]|uniref:Uncharacterized protein n=1 Tax=Alicyclobacillus sacchari TaxID=392010 RepID=A0A4V3HEX6_9BACL|nr:hypothetical protein [Alicyclobacillus sacchari]TDY50621.1 hypothetical protein C7445_102180 [Alicyclobacillus sacchari]